MRHTPAWAGDDQAGVINTGGGWHTKALRQSPRYTTRLKEVLRVG
jgi:hypothetical protein